MLAVVEVPLIETSDSVKQKEQLAIPSYFLLLLQDYSLIFEFQTLLIQSSQFINIYLL
jgi:hypothetical protein